MSMSEENNEQSNTRREQSSDRRFMVSAIDDGKEIKNGMNKFDRFIKRTFDVAFSAVSLVAFSPLYLGCWLAVKSEDKGKVIYAQERIGKHGKPFYIYKFRSMRLDAEKDGPQLYNAEGEDKRLTKVGKFLREHHLDELPQLWNVFKGDMSFIGPRPERRYYIDKIMERDSRYKYLYQIRPGVTSFATLYNGYTNTLDKMVDRLHYDLYYLQNGSLTQDLKLLWLTFAGIVGGKKL
jgi:lipopolysaccharide/colanic/teichoic acid biosynthesis glycosyltransferase